MSSKPGSRKQRRERPEPSPRDRGRAHRSWGRAAAIVPLAVLSAAWTASIAGAGSTTVLADAEVPSAPTLPDGSSVPAEAFEVPASISVAGTSGEGPARQARHTRQISQTASTSGIPAAALAAYQRAETVIGAADEECGLRWQLLAAIGQVESNHGRFGGNSLDADGVARPGIFGIPLDGTRNTATIADTDAGQWDADSTWDRAVGPMQFIPSTWSVVGVDADGDGTRDPQDIDDAALASAVYLCSGTDDLSTPAGQRAAVYRYNHSHSYVEQVLAIMHAYLDGEFTSAPNGVTSAGYLVPASEPTPDAGETQSKARGRVDQTNPASVPTTQPSQEPTQPAEDGGGADGDSGDSDGGGKGKGDDEPQLPTKPSLPPLPSTSIEPVDAILSHAQAVLQCTLEGYIDNILKSDDPFDKCVERYTS